MVCSATDRSTSFRLFAVYIDDKGVKGCILLLIYLCREHFRYFGVFELRQVKSDTKALHEALSFQLQLDGCTHKVMIVANSSALERSCVCFVDAGLEALGCQDEVYLVVNLPIRGVPGCCSKQLCVVGECWQG